MTETQLINEIKSKFKRYYDEGMISDTSIVMEMKRSLKEFGNDIMVNNMEVEPIENYKIQLPNNFWAINKVDRIEPEYYKCNKKALEYVKKDRVFMPWIAVCDNVCQEISRVQREYKKRFPWGIVTIGVNKHQPLKIVKPFNYNPLHNKYTNFDELEVSIHNNRYIQTRINKGLVLLDYRGIPTTEEGEMYVPSTDSGSLVEYVVNRVSEYILSELIISGQAPNMISMLEYFERKKRESHIRASGDVKMKNVTREVVESQRNNNRIYRHRNLR